MQSIKFRLLLVAALVGVGFAAAHGALYSALTGQQWTLANLDLVNVGMVATPYVILALLAVRRVVPWVVALTLTTLVWGYLLYDTVSYRLHPDGSGVNIGVAGLVVLSPFLISVAAFAVHFALEDAGR